MVSIGINEVGRGNAIRVDGDIFVCVAAEHVKPGKGPAYVQMKLKHAVTGRILDKRFRSADTIEQVDMNRVEANFSYVRGHTYVFLQADTYEEIELSEGMIEEKKSYLIEGGAVSVCMVGSQVLSVVFPKTVVLEVVETEPGIKNASATNVGKPAKTNTGLVVTVPPFINVGDRIKVDTDTGAYLERSNA
ncbi:MAG: elongation factor P [Planctomycetota bacterium]